MSTEPRPHRLEVVGVLALTAAAMALRLYHYGERDIWLDEADTRMLVHASFWAPVRAALEPPVSVPPLHYWFVKLANALHLGGAQLRLPSVVLGAATVPLVWALTRRMASARAALLAALLLTISPIHVRYSQQARPYTLLFAETLTFLMALLDVKSRGARVWLAALLGAALTLTHYSGVAVATAGTAWLLWERRDRAAWTVAAAVGVGTLLASILLLHEIGGPPPLPVFAYTRQHFLAFVAWLGFGLGRPLAAGIWLMPVLALCGLAQQLRARRRETYLLLLVAAAPIVAMVALPARSFFVRYALHALPLLLAWAAIGLADVVGLALARVRNELCVVGAAVFAVLAATPLSGFYRERTTPYAAVARTINAAGVPGDIIDLPLRGALPLSYWGPRYVATFRPPLDPRFLTRVKDPREILGDESRAWTITWWAPREPTGNTEIMFPAGDALSEAEADVLGQYSTRLSIVLRAPDRFANQAGRARILAAAQAEMNDATLLP
jgi:4-amino-4-deoxy-L-arabinose transferase-like glycosyltransferase